MKNFYDITVIDTKDKLKIQIELIEHDNPKYSFFVNDFNITPIFYIKADLLETLSFKCNVRNGAIEVAKIIINENEVMPKYLHLATPPTSWITTKWEFTIPGPFYPWYHEITGQGWIA